MDVTSPTGAGGWTMFPIGFLRQAGFPLDLLAPLGAPELSALVGVVDAAEVDLRSVTARLRAVMHDDWDPARRDATAARIGQGRFPRAREARILRENPATCEAMADWEEALSRRDGADQAFRTVFRDRAQTNRLAVVSAFADDALRQVLLLSNDSGYEFFANWLDTAPDAGGGAVRQRVDTLARYLQRVCTKNETHSHFGPFTPVRSGPGTGWSWTDGGAPVRTAFLAHWAAQEIAHTVARRPEFRGLSRPRTHPMAFLSPNRVVRYDLVAEPALGPDHWRLGKVADRAVDEAEHWLLAACDGDRRLDDLRAEFADRALSAAWPKPDFDELVATLTAEGWVGPGLEIPTGSGSALRDLQAAVACGPAADEIKGFLDLVAEVLHRFEEAGLPERAAIFDELKTAFVDFTGRDPHRGRGEIYADRAVLFEECRSGLRSARVGHNVTDFITEELSIAYELILLRPRLRSQREAAILDTWCRERYWSGAEVPLAAFYEDYFSDIERIRADCADVDRELETAAKRMDSVLLGPDPRRHRVEVAAEDIRALLAEYPNRPAAILNPDVMFLAENFESFESGEFGAVIGDCHAVRDLITHTSVAPLLATEHPDLAALATEHYQTLVDEGELLVDIVRRHSAKTDAQVPLLLPDLEVYGRSGKERADVLRPTDLYIRVGEERVDLRARGRADRLRLLACPAGSPSIIGDPLAAFAFPRQFGGAIFSARGRSYIPRITCGRVVLAREHWRIPADRVAPGSAGDEAADFAAAQRLRRAFDLPNPVFAKTPSESKPVYVDWDSPILVRQLTRMARTDGRHVDVGEMLPGPDHLWLRQDGHGYTSEFRCVLFTRGTR